MVGLPHFPQLKLSIQAQPGPDLPEDINIERVFVLAKAGGSERPDLQRLPTKEAVQALISHTAGTRMFDPDMLANHLAFCTKAASETPVYRLVYPHRRDVLSEIRELVEKLC
jgi:hypothetical protein